MSSLHRFAVVGAGAIAHTWVEALATHPEIELVGISDVVEEKARQLAASADGCVAHADTRDMLETLSPEAVVICTPPSTHRELTEGALAAGSHVLCEKPLSITPQDAHSMIAAAKRAERLLTMASKFRYVSDVAKAKSIVGSGILGEIVLFENAFTGRVDMTDRWNSNPALSGGGVLIDNGTHSLDLLRFFLGPVEELQVVEGKRSQNLEVEETVRIFARSTTGVMGTIDLSWSIDKELETFINIYGTRGTIQVGWKESKYRQHGSPGWVVFGQGYNKLQAFQSQASNFCKAIRREEPLLIKPEDGLASVYAVQAAYESLSENHWTTIDDPPVMAVTASHG